MRARQKNRGRDDEATMAKLRLSLGLFLLSDRWLISFLWSISQRWW